MRQVQVEGEPPDFPRLAAEMLAAQYEAVSAAAEGSDAIVACGITPAAAAARSVADQLGIRYQYATYCPVWLRSPHHRPLGLPGWPIPPEETDNTVLWDLQAEGLNTVFGPSIKNHRESIGLPPVEDVGDHVFTDRPWLAADPTLGPWVQPADLDVVQTGAWILPDERPLPADVEAFLDDGTPPVYVGFGSIPMRAAEDVARDVIEAVRAQGRRVLVSGGWAELGLIDQGDDCLAVGEANHQALFARTAAVVHHGGAGTTTDGRPRRRATGGGAADRGPAVLGGTGGRAGHRRGARWPDPDLRVPVSRAQDGSDPRDRRTSGRRGRHDPRRWGGSGREAVDRWEPMR